MNEELLNAIEADFLEHADPVNAVSMQRYLKDQFVMYGLKAPVRQRILKPHLKRICAIYPELPENLIREMWSRPQREWQHAAIELLQKYHRNAPPESIRLYEDLTLAKSWWDTVDFIASWMIGSYFKSYPEQILPYTRKWMDSGNCWLQRTALLFQLKYKSDLDWPLLRGYILELSGEKEFFIRKAIGWILREYGKVAPDIVRDFVYATPQLSGLSRREALKRLEKQTK